MTEDDPKNVLAPALPALIIGATASWISFALFGLAAGFVSAFVGTGMAYVVLRYRRESRQQREGQASNADRQSSRPGIEEIDVDGKPVYVTGRGRERGRIT